MKKTATARRVPRQIGADDDDENEDRPDTAQKPDSVIKRPSSKTRKPSSLRRSYGPSAATDEDDDTEASVVTPKRSTLSRIAIQKNASKRSSTLASQLPRRDAEDDEERPSYNAASLQALKNSTPTTPRDLSSATTSDLDEVSTGTQALDLSAKFGSSLSQYQPFPAIPSAAEIAEKKARRARLAKEEAAEYISLDLDDPDLDDDLDPNVMRDDLGRLVLKPKDKYGTSESRLVREDEDIMENFEEFTEDGKIVLGHKAEAESERRRRQEMAAQIADAEEDSESDDSERERNEAFERSQTKHGTYAESSTSSDPANQRPKTPPIITPLPTLDGAIERLRKQLADMQTSRMQKLQDMEKLQREKIRLADEEIRIQRALKETSEKFQQLRQEKGISAAKKEGTPAAIEAPLEEATNGNKNPEKDVATREKAEEDVDMGDMDEDDEVDEDERPAFGGLGFGTTTNPMLGAGGFGLGYGGA